jgi:transposase
MPAQYDDSTRNAAQLFLVNGLKPSQVAAYLPIGERQARRYKRNIRIFGCVLPPPYSKQGRPAKLHVAAQEAIIEFLEENPMARQDEMVQFLEDEYEIHCDRTSISRILKKLKITKRKTSPIHPDRDDQLRARWLGTLTQFHASQVVVVDESAVDQRNPGRRMGWSAKGLPYRVNGNGIRGTRWSLLPAITTGGYIEYEIYQGSFDTQRFNSFIRKLLEHRNPWPGPLSVLVMDSIHQSDELKEMCQQRGVLLEYLPPYSPDYSLIELSFHMLKAWIRRNISLAQHFNNDLEFFHLAVRECGIKENAKGFFQQCHFSIDPIEQSVKQRES